MALVLGRAKASIGNASGYGEEVDGAPRRVRLDVLVSETHTPRGAGFPILLRPSRPTPGADIQAGPDRARTLSSRLPTASFASTTVRAVVLRGNVMGVGGDGDKFLTPA